MINTLYHLNLTLDQVLFLLKEGISMYTIGQVSEMFGLPISTLRYYDKEGFFPNLERKGNIRHFSENELEAIRVIECLKRSGLEIKDIKQFFEWVIAGPSSYEKRKELFEMRKLMVKDEIKKLEKSLVFIHLTLLMRWQENHYLIKLLMKH